MTVILIEILIILGLLVVNGIFAMSELAVVSAKKVRLEHRAERGDRGAEAALALAADSAGFLSTVQVGITLIGVIASVFGGATIAEILATRFEQVSWLAEHGEAVALAIVVAGITFLSLIIGELVPKRIALSDPERVAALVARPMRVVARVAHPLVAFLTFASNLVLNLFGLHGRTEPGLTEDEIHALVEQGAESGVVPQAEHDMVEGIFRLGDRQVAAIMTPRPDVEWVEVDADLEAIREALVGHGRRHLLLCEESVEHVVGVLYVDDLLRACLGKGTADLRASATAPVYVPATMPVLRLLDVLREARQRVAIVLDEYGGLHGVVTVEDVLEEIVGRLPARGEIEERGLHAVNPDAWTADGALLVEELEEALDLSPLDAAGTRGFRTLGGFMMTSLGRVPAVGDAIEQEGFRFVVEAMDGRRVERVSIERGRPA